MTLDDEILEQKSKDVAQTIGTLFKLFNYELYCFFFFFLMFCTYLIIGVCATISNFKFILYLFILHEVLQSINILSTQLQLKGTTLGRSVNLIKGIISTLENNRSAEHFSQLWDNIEKFCFEHNISINIPLQGNNLYYNFIHQFKCIKYSLMILTGLKRLRKEPTYLSDYDVTFSTAAEQSNNYLSDDDSDKKEYWKLNAFYVIMDSIICSMKIRFSEESLFLVEHYKVGYI